MREQDAGESAVANKDPVPFVVVDFVAERIITIKVMAVMDRLEVQVVTNVQLNQPKQVPI